MSNDPAVLYDRGARAAAAAAAPSSLFFGSMFGASSPPPSTAEPQGVPQGTAAFPSSPPPAPSAGLASPGQQQRAPTPDSLRAMLLQRAKHGASPAGAGTPAGEHVHSEAAPAFLFPSFTFGHTASSGMQSLQQPHTPRVEQPPGNSSGS